MSELVGRYKPSAVDHRQPAEVQLKAVSENIDAIWMAMAENEKKLVSLLSDQIQLIANINKVKKEMGM